MAASSVRSFLVVIPDPLIRGLEASPGGKAHSAKDSDFSLHVTDPNVVTLHTADVPRNSEVKGLLHFPILSEDSECFLKALPGNTTISDGLNASDFSAIGFAPWKDPTCNKVILKAATQDTANLKGFLFYTEDHEPPPSSSDNYWSGVEFKKLQFPVYAIGGLEGQHLKNAYLKWGNSDQTTEDVEGNFGSPRVFVKIATTTSVPLPGLWLFLLIVLGVLIFLAVFTSATMHLIQWRRRRSLRRRVANGEVDLEALGIKRLVVPRKMLDKIPLRTYVASEPSRPPSLSPSSAPQPSPEPPQPSRILAPPSPPLPPAPTATLSVPPPHLPPNSRAYSQPSCSICLDDFTSHVTTVRELDCNHIFHPACIDSFLETQSSLCPVCKRSTLPKGYVPPELTNATVRRERRLRHRRRREEQRRTAETEGRRGRLGRLGIEIGRGGSESLEMRSRGGVQGRRLRRATGVVRNDSGGVSQGSDGYEARARGRWQRGFSAVFPGFR